MYPTLPRHPQIPAFDPLARLHSHVSPAALGRCAQATQQKALKAGADTWAGRGYSLASAALKDTTTALHATDWAFGASTGKQTGIMGRAAWGLCGVASAVLCAPTLLCGDRSVARLAQKGVHHTLLKPFAFLCTLGALVGLGIKVGLVVALVPAAFVVRGLGQALEVIFPDPRLQQDRRDTAG
jgi:hypothetical protein